MNIVAELIVIFQQNFEKISFKFWESFGKRKLLENACKFLLLLLISWEKTETIYFLNLRCL